jgi:ABC-type lipoprotein release transport system permease subunit
LYSRRLRDRVGGPFVQFPTLPWLAVFIPIAAVIAVLAAALPARRAAALPVADALRYE